jgi:type I restriction enzyme S subunit
MNEIETEITTINSKEWIDTLPKHWEVRKIKHIASLKGRIGWQGLTSAEYIDEGPYLITGTDFNDGNINWNTCVHVSEKRWEEAPEIQISNDDLLITKDGTIGKVAIVQGLDSKASLNSGIMLITTNNECDKNYLFWILSSEVFWAWFNNINAGSSTINHLYQYTFTNFDFCFPTIQEQSRIAKIVTAECNKIDTLISKIEKQIEALEHYKKAVIFESVTKGLDLSVSMKESGIVWVNEIPQSWDIAKLKHISYLIGSGSTPKTEREDYYDLDKATNNWIQSGDIHGQILSTTEKKITDIAVKETNALKRYDKNFIVIAMYGGAATIGNVSISSIDSYVNQACCVFSDFRRSDMTYVYYSLIAARENLISSAVGGVQSNINQGMLKNLIIAQPSEKEQNKISSFLDEECKKIDSIIEKKQKLIEKIQIHKKSLIYEYVTGKKRVEGS